MKSVTVFLLIVIPIAVQSQWVYQNPLPQNNTLKSVNFVTSTTAYAVGDYGTVIKTVNGGVSWSVLQFPIDASIKGKPALTDVCFTDANIGWVVGGGDIYKTTDGGATWSQQTNPNIFNTLYSIYFTDANTGYIVGSGALVLKTTNGGSKWTALTLPSTYYNDVVAISFTNAQYGIVAGSSGGFVLTTDGGATWSVNASTYGANALCFADPKNVVAVGNGGAVYKSTDGGVTWTKQTISNTSDLYSVSFNNSTNGVATSSIGKIIQTTDGGTTWKNVTSGITDQAYSVSFNQSTGLVVGNLGSILRSTDNGATWLAANSGFRNNLNASYFFDANTGFVVGDSSTSNGIMFKTTNGGTTWQKVGAGWVDLTTIYFTDANTGWTGGPSIGIYKTTDGGATWNKLTNFNYSAYKIYFLNSTTGWVLDATYVIRTTDGGATWTKSTTSTYATYSLFFVNANIGFAGHSSGIVWKTWDGGNTWFQLPSLAIKNNPMRSIYFSDTSKGWVATTGLQRTTDGGKTWTNQGVTVTNWISSLCFIPSTTKAIAVGAGGQFLSSTDGGNSWTTAIQNTTSHLNYISFVNSNVGWAIGYNGTVLKTTVGGITGVSKAVSVPDIFSLSQNYPNPFNPSTVISYQLSVVGSVKLSVFDLLGREVTTLVNEVQTAGNHKVTFDAHSLSSGIYFYRLTAGKLSQIKKMILIK